MDEELSERAQALARHREISLGELIRRSLQDAVRREKSNDPWMAFAGILEGQPGDSESVDVLVDARGELDPTLR